MKQLLAIVLAVLLVVAFSFFAVPRPQGVPPITRVESPAAMGSEGPSLSVAPDGRVYMSWLELVEPETYALRYSSRPPGGQWAPAQTITTGSNWFVSYADYPSILALPDGSLAAHWFVNAAEPYLEAYHLNLSISRDGKTWSEPIVPYEDRSVTQHGLVSLTSTPDGRIGIAWLDGRQFSDTVDDIALMYAQVALDGTVEQDIQVDPRVCECCQTSLATTSEGMVLAYRDRTAEEVRDISIVRRVNGQWSEPHTVATDNWEINACPINGPSISANGRNVVVAWFTAVGDVPRVYAAFSADSGNTFGAPIRIDQGNSLGRVDVQVLPSGDALVSWIEVEQNGSIRVRRVAPDGRVGNPTVVSETSSSTSSGFPQLVKAGNEFIMAWTQPGETNSVQTAILNIR